MQVLLKNERPRCLFCDAGGSSSKSIVEAVEAATKPAEDAAAEAIFEAIEEAAIVTAEAESIVAGAATGADHGNPLSQGVSGLYYKMDSPSLTLLSI